MSVTSKEFNFEKKRVLKIFLIDIFLLIVCAGIILIGIFFHNMNVISFFGVIEALLGGFMLLIIAERFEINQLK